MIKRFLISTITILGLSLTFISCKQSHFLSDKTYREQVHQDYLERINNLNHDAKQFTSVVDNLPAEEREAMEFLYAYMPLSDLADYDAAFYLQQVRTAFEAKATVKWGDSIPEEIFRHFVLVYRVNNENLDTARSYIFHTLKDRVKDMSMYDAALEVNHWCHEHVAYRPSDGRTSSPLATLKTGLGRCGEESTLTVTALRAVGIPARQCYTPRWAHTDDNHAWVEVWVNNRWYFMGACEPDPELNMGWFSIPSTRTMMVHSNVFGKYTGSEEVNYQTNLYSRINLLPNYTETKKINITVNDSQGKPVEGAAVSYKLYNYAEYYSIASNKTDAKGISTLTTGLGDLLIWASKDGKYGYQKIDVRQQSELTVTLNRNGEDDYLELLEMVPPTGNQVVQGASKSKVETNNCRLAYEDSLRTVYAKSFISEEEISKITNDNHTAEQIHTIMLKSEGNYAEWVQFLSDNKTKKESLYLYEFINALSDKDFRDAEASTLQQHLTTYKTASYPLEVYFKGIIPARISNEGLRTWRADLQKAMTGELGTMPNVSAVKAWIIKNVKIDQEANYFNCPISPMGVYRVRISDAHSRDIFFVAACRALNIPSYLDPATAQLFVYENNSWNNVSFTTQEAAPVNATLILNNPSKDGRKLEYWIHYTLAKYKDGEFVTFDYEDDPRVAQFPIKLDLEAGYYLLSTGIRYSDGTALSRLEFFNIAPNETVTKDVLLRKLTPREAENYGKIDLEYLLNIDNKQMKISELTKEKKLIVCFIEPSREPTKHLFKDVKALKKEFELWGGNMLFVVPEEKAALDFHFGQWGLPKQAICIEDKNSAWFNNIIETTKQYFRDNYPVVYIIDKEGAIIFKTEGYRIGTGELLYQSL